MRVGQTLPSAPLYRYPDACTQEELQGLLSFQKLSKLANSARETIIEPTIIHDEIKVPLHTNAIACMPATKEHVLHSVACPAVLFRCNHPLQLLSRAAKVMV